MKSTKLKYFLGLLLIPICSFAQRLEISMEGGDLERKDSIATFQWPQNLVNEPASEETLYADKSGKFLVRVQDGMGTMVIRSLEKTASKKVVVQKILNPSVVPAIKLNKTDDGKLRFHKGSGNVPLEYFIKARLPRKDIDSLYLRSGYLHPIKTPSGVVVSDDYPEMHTHHHGIWYTWTKTKFENRTPDFWNMGKGAGRVEFVDLLAHWDGPVHAGFTASHRFVDMTSKPEKEVLSEKWSVHMYAVGFGKNPYNIFDLRSSQTNMTESKLELPEYRYGGLGFRGRSEWNGKENCFFLTSNGERDRTKAHATKANWCYIGGLHEGKMVGIVVMCHPDNFRSPQPMRVHPNEPFFNYAPSQGGDWSISPGETYNSKYRFVVMDGGPNVGIIERLWNDYATPVKVSVKLFE